MPTQQEIEYHRLKHQQFSSYKLKWAVLINMVSNMTCAPFEMIKIRAQLLQEGRRFHGGNSDRGVPAFKVFNEMIEAGYGTRGMWTGFDSLFVRSFWYGGFRSYFWSLSYNYYNSDPRRTKYWGGCSLFSFLGGFAAGVISNPVDLVYTRQAADGLYPNHLQRKYKSFIDGISKAYLEGALMRGALPAGISIGMLHASMSGIYDFLKEYHYWFYGPALWLRPLMLAPTALVGLATYLPFDNVKTRFHTMTPLPNGQMPYKSFGHAVYSILLYEGNYWKYSSGYCFFTGGVPAFIRLYISLLIGVYMTDYAFTYNYNEGEFYLPSNYYSGPSLGVLPHDPYNREELIESGPVEKDVVVSLGPGTDSYIKY